ANHFGSLQLRTNLLSISNQFHSASNGLRLRINDMSLRDGGIFDFNNQWNADHNAHRWGHNADIDLYAENASGQCVSLDFGDEFLSDQYNLFGIIFNVTGVWPVFEGDHIHLNRAVR
ncbi:MAG: hypothetical protein AB7N65_28880, partial [Vicinamibacterales bacterium]